MDEIAIVAIALFGCTDRQAKPDPVIAPTEPVTVVPLATAAATPSPAPSVAPTPKGTAAPPEKLPPKTTDCKTDAECALTNHQTGCCVGACRTYATNAARLAEIESIENCAAMRATKICPPPAPCPEQTQIPKTAICRKGSCDVVY